MTLPSLILHAPTFGGTPTIPPFFSTALECHSCNLGSPPPDRQTTDRHSGRLTLPAGLLPRSPLVRRVQAAPLGTRPGSSPRPQCLAQRPPSPLCSGPDSSPVGGLSCPLCPGKGIPSALVPLTCVSCLHSPEHWDLELQALTQPAERAPGNCRAPSVPRPPD